MTRGRTFLQRFESKQRMLFSLADEKLAVKLHREMVCNFAERYCLKCSKDDLCCIEEMH